nr:PREDICTED: uncharacterized protein LOC109032099 isoform X2 [Bemisia tabaci]
MNEDIAFLDWAEKLDSGTNHWLPAYGFQQPSHIQEVLLQERNSDNINDDDHGCGSGGGTFLFLETIVEETSDDLRSESDYSVGPVGWPDSDSDAHSVIHVPNHFDSTSVWNGSERDLAVPKKRRRRGVGGGGGGGVHNTDPGVHDEEDEADDEEQPSRSSSLLQFETLERHCLDYETVFKTSATSEPFLHASSSLNSHFYLDQPKWTFTTFKPPKEPDEDLSSLSSQCSSTSSREISSSENEASLLSRCSKSISSQPDRSTVQRGPSSLRTFRSFDSLVPDRPSVPEKSNDFASLNSLRFSDKSQSLNLNEAFLDSFEDEPASTVIPVSRSFYKTVDCLSSLDSTDAKKRDSLEYKDTDPEKKVEQEAEKIQGAQRSKDDAAKVYLQRSAENLSEDSGFGDGHALKGSVSSLLQLRRTSSSSAVFPIPEDEADFQYSPRPVLPRPPDEGTRPAAAAAGAEKLKLAKGGEEIPRGEEGPAAINSSWQSGTAADGDVEPAASVVSCASPVSCAPKPSKVNRSLLSEFSASEKDEAVIRPEPKREPPPLPTAPVPTRPRVVRNDSFKMASRLPVVSTPNLHNLITDEEFAQIQEHKTQLLQEDEYLSRSYSLKKMATNFSESKLNKKNSKSSGSNIQITTSFVNLSSTTNGSNKGVHFCPIVSEVSWQETYSSDEESSGGEYESEDNEYSELNGSGSSGSSPEKDSSSSPELDALVEKLLSSGNAGEPRREIMERRNSERAKMMQEYIKQNIIGGNLHMHDRGSPLPSAPAATAAVGAHAGSHVAGPVRAHSAPASAAPVSARTMDEPVSKRKSNKLGGFFQRFSFRRRKPRKEEHPKVRAEDTHNLNLNNNNNSDSAVKSAEVLVIPLHDAGTGASEPEAVVSSKPPLPKLPPRTVGVGSSQGAQGVKRSPPRRRPECGDVGLSGAGSGAAVSTMSNVGSIDPTSRVGLLETDLDSNVTSSKHGAPSKKARSLLNLEGPHDMTTLRPVCNINPDANYLANNVDSRAKSMEFLLDKENHAAIQPPENQLQKVGGDRILSEHELRVQKSLQKLNVPDWYKNSNVPSSGFILKRHSDAGHGHGHHSHLTLQPWQGLSSKTTSLSSLGSSYSNSAGHGPPPRSPTGSHRGGMMSPSPTPTHVFSRWSTTRLNSGCTSSNTSPCSSARSSFNYRQPYLGWRSQERLNKPRTPAERLAAGLLPQQKQQVQNVPSLTDVQTSIKEVTAAIVHYVSNRSEACNPSPKWNNELSTSPSRSASPRGSTGRLCWLESSFVGSRPTEIPATPNVTDLKSSEINNKDLFLDLNNHRVHSPITNRCSQNGSASKTGNNEKPANSVTEAAPAMNLRRVSFDAAVSNSQNSGIPDTLVRCRYNKCNKVADVSEARRTFKTCHNCAHVYCSRECRRAHWEKHRKTCLHSRVGSLCRQVLNASKEDPDSLNHLSLIARRGYLSQGRGAVKSFFSSPEMAEKFVKNGFSFLGEPTFIAWSDILPSEMNSDLYTELIRLCKNYNPDTRFVLYVAVCVVSEVPTRGAVKWERQVVSRCAKIRLCQSLMSRHPIDGSKTDTNSTLILTSLPGNDGSQRARQISFTNIQRHLRHRGVSLQKHFPDVYKNLCAYVEGTSERFTPVTIYPKDSHSGKTFMCVIMLDSEPEQVNMVPRGNTPSQTIDVSVEQ